MPAFLSVPDKEKNHQSYMVFSLTILWSVTVGLIVSFGFYFFPNLWLRWLSFLSISIIIGVLHLILNKYGFVKIASLSLPITVWLFITIPCYSAGGVSAPGILSQLSVILTAGFLLGWRGGLAFGFFTISADFYMAYLETIGKLPFPSVVHTPITRWIGSCIPFGTILALQYYSTNHLRTSLIALQKEIVKREKTQKEKDQLVNNLTERIKEINTLYRVNQILQDEDESSKILFQKIVEVIPAGWQYPEITSASLTVNGRMYTSSNYKPYAFSQISKGKSNKGTEIVLEVGYSKIMPLSDEGPFLKEERNLINMLQEMLKTAIERREQRAELKDYKYALDTGYSIAISEKSGSFLFVNGNFCEISKYKADELLSKHHSTLWSGIHKPEYFDDLKIAMEGGKPFKGEFCNQAKDGSLYWVDTTIVPFLDDNGEIYQFLSINHDITERKESEEKIKQSEELLRRITSQIPGNTYMFEIVENGNINILFMSHGSENFKENYDDTFKKVNIANAEYYDNDKEKFTNAMIAAFNTNEDISVQYRILVKGEIRWRWMKAIPEIKPNGKTIWYGSTTDITSIVDYLTSIEQIIFDISHVIRRPITSMMGMTNLITDCDLSEIEIIEIDKKLNIISEEMDKFVKELYSAYNQKRLETDFKIDIPNLINTRDNLFQ